MTGLPPGQALDVGCGEGADAIWLARHGWQVTAVDISRTALLRAAQDAAGHAAGDEAARDEAAGDEAGRVAWARADLTVMAPPAGSFDLVSAQYFPLPRRPGHTALRGLLAAVAPGGTLLFVGHDLAGLPPRHELDADPGDFYQPADIAGLLDRDWAVLINETRPRTDPSPAGTRHTHDTVLRARRLR